MEKKAIFKNRILILISAIAMFAILTALSIVPAGVVSAEENSRLADVLRFYVGIINDEYDTDVTIGEVKTLEDFAGNGYTLVECEPEGYFIMCNDSATLVEYSGTSVSPYKGFQGDLYYGGAGYFFIKRNDNLYDIFNQCSIDSAYGHRLTATSEELYADIMEEKNTNILAYIKGNTVMKRSASLGLYGKTWKVVNNADFFRNKRNTFQMSYYADGNKAYSGYVCASMLLGYYDTFKGHFGLVNNNYMTGSGVNRNFCTYKGKSFTEAYLVKILKREGINHWSTSTQIRKVMDAYFREQGSGLKSYDMIMPFFSSATIKKQIDANNPVILCGNIESPSTPSGGQSGLGSNDRAVLVYGYYKKSATKYAFLVHYAQSGYSESTVNHFSSSAFGSMYIIK